MITIGMDRTSGRWVAMKDGVIIAAEVILMDATDKLERLYPHIAPSSYQFIGQIHR